MKTRWIDRCRAAALALALGLSGVAPAAALELLDVTRLLAQRKAGEARFTEERFVSGFDAPLRASGTLSFSPPDRFTRMTLTPRAESMVVEGNRLTLTRGGRTRLIMLDTVPEVTALIEAVRGTMTGNAATLEQHFHVRLEGNVARWTMLLEPRDSRLASQVREIKITGVRSEMRVVELWLAGGDRSVMVIENVQALQ